MGDSVNTHSFARAIRRLIRAKDSLLSFSLSQLSSLSTGTLVLRSFLGFFELDLGRVLSGLNSKKCRYLLVTIKNGERTSRSATPKPN